MTNSANEPLPVDRETAINDDTAEFDPIPPSVAAEDDQELEKNEGVREHADLPETDPSDEEAVIDD